MEKIKSELKRIGSITDAELYLEQNSKPKEKSENKLNLSNISWASQLDELDIRDTELNNSSKSINNEENNIVLDPITLKNLNDIIMDKLNDIEILRNQLIILQYLKKIIKISIEKKELINKQNYIEKFKWLCDSATKLANKLGLNVSMNNIKKKSKVLYRSSYNFCKKGHNCEFNYGNAKKKCKGHHYLHNLIVLDVHMLINYIENKECDNIEILKSINTLSYVITHMYDELKKAQINNKNNNVHVETCHKYKIKK